VGSEVILPKKLKTNCYEKIQIPYKQHQKQLKMMFFILICWFISKHCHNLKITEQSMPKLAGRFRKTKCSSKALMDLIVTIVESQLDSRSKSTASEIIEK
jgi:hypothetical protein